MPNVKKPVLACVDCGRNLIIKHTRNEYRRRMCAAGHTHFTKGDQFVDSGSFYFNEGTARHLRDLELGKANPRPAPPPRGRVFGGAPKLRTGHYVVKTSHGIVYSTGIRERSFSPDEADFQGLNYDPLGWFSPAAKPESRVGL